MKKTTVLIVDDHSIVRLGLASLLGTTDRFAVVGQAEDGEDAVARARELRPDLVVMDLMMPRKDGATATAEILSENPGCKVVVLTTFGSFNGVARALEAGAGGALLKNIDNDAFLAALERIADGGTVVAPEIATMLRKDPPVPELSPRQREFLQLLVQGLTNGEIATALSLQEDSIKKLSLLTFEKIGAANRTQAVAIALRKHLLGK